MLNYDVVKGWPFEEIQQTYTHRDTILYALGIGFGEDPLDSGQLRFTYEKELLAVPSMAAVLCNPDAWLRDPRSGVDYTKVVHGEQDVTLHAPLPAKGTLKALTRIGGVVDKGAGKGAVIELERDLLDQENARVANVRQVIFCRGDGGYTAAGGRSDAPAQTLPSVPEGFPDFEITLRSLPQSALIYRLSGDWNPLHADPDVAAKAGFSRPILHGLCTYGMATRAALQLACNSESPRLKRIAARFSGPVFPGEIIKFQMWGAADNAFHLRARVEARDVTVLNNGWVEFS